ncbi:MAG TPA: HupE/UreJ family protein [Polyangiales bacterium]
MNRVHAYALGALWLSVGWLVPTACWAHALDPSLLVLEEPTAGRVRLTWSGNDGFVANVHWELGACVPLHPPAALPSPSSRTSSMTLQCAERASRAGLTLQGLEAIEGQTLLLRYRYDGQQTWHVRVLDVHDGAVLLPAADAGGFQTLWRFIGLGLSHIAAGADHLLFVSCLLFLFRALRTRLQVITSFTVGHSVTLVLSALGVLQLPQGWVECCIALSLLFMARELLLPEQRRGSLSQHPWSMAVVFGFIHGMGFAGALRELELPREHFMVSLLGFNLGVELGQLLFVACAMSAVHASRRARAVFGAPLRKAARVSAPLGRYAVGIVSAFWFWQRLHGALSP